MKTSVAREFLAKCFSPGETIAILLRREKPAPTTQRIVTLERVLASRYLGWLAYQNANGANVYVAANPLRPGSRRRTKECIASVRHLYLDIDVDGEARLAALKASGKVPSPSAVLSTSPAKYQVLWTVQGFDFERQESTLKQLAFAFGGDCACTDCNRVLHIPGFSNRKYEPASEVTVEYPNDSVSSADDFRLDGLLPNTMSPLSGVTRISKAGKRTHSEQDWAWVLTELTRGEDPRKLTLALASRRSDKPNPSYYAQRTVDLASARILLLNGAPIGGVATVLTDRRRNDVPAAFCSSRALEIATTAQRMIHRSKLT